MVRHLTCNVRFMRTDSEASSRNVPDGRILRTLREGAGLSARAVAQAAGISHSHLLRIESGERTAAPETMRRLIHALATTTDRDVAS